MPYLKNYGGLQKELKKNEKNVKKKSVVVIIEKRAR